MARAVKTAPPVTTNKHGLELGVYAPAVLAIAAEREAEARTRAAEEQKRNPTVVKLKGDPKKHWSHE